MRGTNRSLLQRLQLLAGLKPHGLSRRNGNFGAGPRIPSDSSLARLHVEHSEAAQFDAVTLLQSLLHGFEDGFHRHFRFGLGNSGPVDDLVDNIQLDQVRPPPAARGELVPAIDNHMIGLNLSQCQARARRRTRRRFPETSFAAPAGALRPGSRWLRWSMNAAPLTG